MYEEQIWLGRRKRKSRVHTMGSLCNYDVVKEVVYNCSSPSITYHCGTYRKEMKHQHHVQRLSVISELESTERFISF